MKASISAIIHTLNEEPNIANAIKSVTSWVDEVIVVDMQSDDRTVEIATAHGAKVFLHERTGFVEPARAFAEDQASGNWILVLDADEIVPQALSRELLMIAEMDSADICRIPRLNYFGGYPLLHTGWGPAADLQARFYQKGALVHSRKIHAAPKEKEGSRVLSLKYRNGSAIVHFNYLNVSHCIQKLDRYTDIEASQMNSRGRRAGAFDLVLRPVSEFLNRYIRRQGFRDGWPGFYYSFLMAFYRATQAMKLREIERAGSPQVIRDGYQAIADEHLSHYNSDRHSANRGD
jgi:glycosyltransferase involved in cell wall biosynthesis